MEISINALMLAIKAIQRDIEQHRACLGDIDISDEDADYHSEYVMELTHALGEIGDVYEHSRAATPEAPALDQLLRGEDAGSALSDANAAQPMLAARPLRQSGTPR